MKTIAWGMLVAALACGSGCARPDWIEQTLVTVDEPIAAGASAPRQGPRRAGDGTTGMNCPLTPRRGAHT
jgi:hypothetical protein